MNKLFRTLFGFLFLLAYAFPAGADDFTFVVIGDTRPPAGKAKNDYTNFIGQMDEIKKYRPRLVINLGDLIWGYGVKPGTGEWKAYKSIIAKYDFKYYQIPGNHDVASLKSETIYQREFGPLYFSFDAGGIHFVMLDNSERSIWGYIGQAQFAWLQSDLEANRGKKTFVFMHVAPWHKVLVDKKYHLFWKNRLHPLFAANKVIAVFAGHIHQYGPTYEFDGIKYFITAGGGAELMKSYKDFGGNYHFMTVTVSGDRVEYRVVLRGRSLTDEEADVRKNRIFAAENTNSLTLDRGALLKKKSLPVELTLTNPYYDNVAAELSWTYDKSVFRITPEKTAATVGRFATRRFRFTVGLAGRSPGLYEFPTVTCTVKVGDKTISFAKDLAITRTVRVKKRAAPAAFTGDIAAWGKSARLELASATDETKSGLVYLNYDSRHLYIAAHVKNQTLENRFDGNMIFLNDAFVVGIDPNPGKNTVDSGDIQLEFSMLKDQIIIYDRVNGETLDPAEKGIVCRVTKADGWVNYEIALPVGLLGPIKLKKGTKFGFNCAIVYSIRTGGERVVEWRPGLAGGLGIDDKFKSRHHFGIVRLD